MRDGARSTAQSTPAAHWRDNSRHVRCPRRPRRSRPAHADELRARSWRAATAIRSAAPSAWRASRATPCSWRSTWWCASRTSTASSAPSSRRWSRNARAAPAACGCSTTTAAASRGWRSSDGRFHTAAMQRTGTTPALPREAMAEHLVGYATGWTADHRIPAATIRGCRKRAHVQRGERHRVATWSRRWPADAQPRMDRAGVGRRAACETTWRRRCSKPSPGRRRWRCTRDRLAEQGRLEDRRQAVLEERNRLARDIHDTLAQGFGAILMQLQAAQRGAGAAAAGSHGARDRGRSRAHAHGGSAPIGRRAAAAAERRRGVAVRRAAAHGRPRRRAPPRSRSS